MQKNEGVSITEFSQMFPNADACLEHLFRARYGPEFRCPRCERSVKLFRTKGYKRYQNNCCSISVYPTSGTIFEKSSIPLDIWFYAILLFSNSRSGVSGRFLERHLGVCHKAAWRIGDRIRTHMALLEGRRTLGGPGKTVQVDETLLRGVRTSNFRGKGRAIIFGMAEGRTVVSMIVPDRKRSTVYPIIRSRIHPESIVITDSYPVYHQLTDYGFRHSMVNHSSGLWRNIHGYSQNLIEQYWAYLKRSIRGTHMHVNREMLWKYLKEYEFRYNRRDRPRDIFWDMVTQFPAYEPEKVRGYTDILFLRSQAPIAGEQLERGRLSTDQAAGAK